MPSRRLIKKHQTPGNHVTEWLPSPRLLAWGEAFKCFNALWLEQLATKLRIALASLSENDLGENGKQLKREDPQSWINKFVVIQVMLPGVREDEKHFDDGASLFHLSITLFGRRRLDIQLTDACNGDAMSVLFTPGNVYAGNLCAAERQVRHESDDDRSKGYNIDGHAMKVTAILRTSLFAAGHERTKKSKLVYEKANRVIADHLRDQPLRMSSFEACLEAEKRIDTGCEQPVAKRIHISTNST